MDITLYAYDTALAEPEPSPDVELEAPLEVAEAA